MALVYRELTPEEFDKAPREVPGSEGYNPGNSRILGAFNEQGEIVSTFTLFLIAHAEPLWIREDYRGSPTIMRRMAEGMKAMLKQYGFPSCYTVVMDSTPVLAKFAKWFGGNKIDGSLYYWVAPKE
jgi:hypothetical protein